MTIGPNAAKLSMLERVHTINIINVVLLSTKAFSATMMFRAQDETCPRKKKVLHTVCILLLPTHITSPILQTQIEDTTTNYVLRNFQRNTHEHEHTQTETYRQQRHLFD